MTDLLSAQPDPAAFPVIRARGADKRYPVTVEACPADAVAPTEVEGSEVICGRVNVPEDHDKPDGTRIDLAFAVLKARTQSPVPDPVIYFHGEAKEDQTQYAAVQAPAESPKVKATGATDLTGRFGDMVQASITGTHSKDAILTFLKAIADLAKAIMTR